MINVYAVAPLAETRKKIWTVYDFMRANKIWPNIITFGSLASGCSTWSEFERVLAAMEGQEVKANEYVLSCAVTVAKSDRRSDRSQLVELFRQVSRKGPVNEKTAQYLLKELFDVPNVPQVMEVWSSGLLRRTGGLYDAVIEGLISAGDVEGALDVVAEAREHPGEGEGTGRSEGVAVVVDLRVYLELVRACEKKGMVRGSLRVMDMMKTDGVDFYEYRWLDVLFKKGLEVFNMIV